MQYLLVFLKGLAMGAADVVPGVSGGTIAFITGIYEKLISSLKAISGEGLQALRKEGLAAAWRAINGPFLLSLFAGIAVSILSLAKLLNYLLEHYPILIWAFFFGLIVASAWLIGRSIEKWNAAAFITLALGLAIAYYITVAAPSQTSESLPFIFLSGAIAICAMILPGISGSFILLLMGKYQYIIESLSELRLEVIAVFAMGAGLGLLSFARLLSWMFVHYKNSTISLLTGFMIGSLNKVWPWKETLSTTINRHGELIPLTQRSIWPIHFEGESQWLGAVLAALLGFLLIWILEKRSTKELV